MLIGLGGGAASSLASGASHEDLDFASVQRDNAEMQRRCQEVIDRCWALGADNPIVSIHDVGAGGLSNALPELVHDSGRGARFELRDDPERRAGHVAARALVQRGAGALRAGDRARARWRRFEALCARERCPFAVRRPRHRRRPAGGRRRALRQPAHRHAAGGAARQAAAHDARRRARRVAARSRFDAPRIELARGGSRACCGCPTVADKTFLITIGDRTVGGLVARDQMVGPWQVPVADAARHLRRLRRLHRRGDGDGRAHARRAARRGGLGAPGGRRGASPTSPRAPIAQLSRRQAVGQLDGRRRPSRARTRASTTPCAPSGIELCPALGIAIPVGKDSMSMRTVWQRRRRARSRDRAAVADRHAPSRRCTDVRRALTPELRADATATTRAAADRPRARPEPPGRLGAGAGLRAARRRRRPTSTTRRCWRASSRPIQAADARRACCSPITTAPTAACS